MLNRTRHLALAFLLFTSFLASFKASSAPDSRENDDDESQLSIDLFEINGNSQPQTLVPAEEVDGPFGSSDSEAEDQPATESNEASTYDSDETRLPDDWAPPNGFPDQLLIVQGRGANDQPAASSSLPQERANTINSNIRVHEVQLLSSYLNSFVTPPRAATTRAATTRSSQEDTSSRSQSVSGSLPFFTQPSQTVAESLSLYTQPSQSDIKDLNWYDLLFPKSSNLVFLEADLASDPILAVRAQRYSIPEHKLPRISGLVARDSARNMYFSFPFHQANFHSRPADLSHLSQAVQTLPESCYSTPVNRKRKTPNPIHSDQSSVKRIQSYGRLDPLHYIKHRLTEAAKTTEIPKSSSLGQYMTVYDNRLGNIELKEDYLIAFEHKFEGIFMDAFTLFKDQMRLSAMILALLPGSDFSKFHLLRERFDLEPRESKDFAEVFLRAIMILPAVSSDALEYLMSPTNAPFLFNHLCTARSDLYAGKFCFEQVAGVACLTKTQFPGPNPLVTALLSELKKPFQLTHNIAVMAISHISYLKSVCFDDKERMLNFMLELLNMYCREKFIQESTSSHWLQEIVVNNLVFEMLQQAVKNGDEESILNLYSVVSLEFEKPRFLYKFRNVSIKMNSPFAYVLELENEIKNSQKTYYDTVVTLVPKYRQ